MRKLGLGIGIIIVAIIVAAVLIPFLVPADWLKQQVIAIASAKTGREIEISGPLRITILPSIGIRAEQVRVSNAPGTRYPDLATLASLRIKLQLLPLFQGRVVIGSCEAIRPVIHLEVDALGRPNWIFGTRSTIPPQLQPLAGPDISRGIATPHLGDVTLSQGLLTYDNAENHRSDTISAIDAAIELNSLDDPLLVKGSAIWRGKPASVDIQLSEPRAIIGGASAQGFTSNGVIRLDSAMLSLAIDGAFTGGYGHGAPQRFDGSIDLAIPSLRDLAAWSGRVVPIGGDTFSRFGLKGRIAGGQGQYALNGAAIDLDEVTAAGDLAIVTSHARPVISGQLDIDALDITPYLPPAPPEAGGNMAAALSLPAFDGSDTPIDLSPLARADLHLDLTVGALRLRRFEIGQSALGIDDTNGKLTLDLAPVSLYGGGGSFHAVLDGSSPDHGAEAQLDLSDVQIGPLLGAALGLDQLTGTGALKLALAGQVRSQRGLIQSLDGTADIHLTDGTMKGLDIPGLLRGVTHIPAAFGAERMTGFSALDAGFTITRGVARNSDLSLKAPFFQITGKGSIDLPRRTLDYRIETKLTAQTRGIADYLLGIAVPVAITGPWSRPSYRLDLAGALAQKLGALGLARFRPPGDPPR